MVAWSPYGGKVVRPFFCSTGCEILYVGGATKDSARLRLNRWNPLLSLSRSASRRPR